MYEGIAGAAGSAMEGHSKTLLPFLQAKITETEIHDCALRNT